MSERPRLGLHGCAAVEHPHTPAAHPHHVTARVCQTSHVITPFCAVVTALAVARVTRLIVADYITAKPRQRLVLRWGVHSMRSYLITCPWCMSLWVAAVAAPVAFWFGDTAWYQVPALGLALSQTVGILTRGDVD